MQVGIPVVYSVCKVKPDNINDWICVQKEEFFSCGSISNCKLKVQLVIGCVKTQCVKIQSVRSVFLHTR